MLNRFIFFSYFPSSSLPHSQSCHAQSLPLDDSPCHGLKPQLYHTEMSFWGKFLLWRGGSNVPLKLSALWVRKCVLSRSLVSLSHLYAQPSRLGCKSAADTGRLCRGRVQLQGQEPDLGNTSAIDSACHRFTSGETDSSWLWCYLLNSPLLFWSLLFWFHVLPVQDRFTKLTEKDMLDHSYCSNVSFRSTEFFV